MKNNSASYYERNRHKILAKKKAYYLKNKERIARYKNELYSKNKNLICEYNKNYYGNNKRSILDNNKKYYNDNKAAVDRYRKNYIADNKEDVAAKNKIYCLNNKEKILNAKRAYRIKNKVLINKKNNMYVMRRKSEDIGFRLRKNISRAISFYLVSNKGSKNGQSILPSIQYSIHDLKIYLESLFESWMNWSNYGSYKLISWLDNDSSTWIWQIDHIVPQSSFNFTSMQDDDFKKCWALENLRPYSAKQNILDGDRRLINKLTSDIS